MKFTLSWLRDHLDTDASQDAICDALTRVGLELEGVENRGAALALGISEHTVKFHVGSALGKLGARSRTEAVSIAARMGLLPM